MTILKNTIITPYKLRNKRLNITGGTLGGSTSVSIGGSSSDGLFELRTDPNGTPYIFTNLDLISAKEITAYSSNDAVVSSIWDDMPVATDTTIGGIILGSGLTIDENGVVSVTGGSQTLSFANNILSISGGNSVDLSGLSPDLSGYATETWVTSNFAPADISVDGLSDVIITSILSGEILKWNGTVWVNNTLAEAGISAVGHTHTIANVTGLQTALDGKAASIHSHLKADITDFAHTHTISDVTNLQTTLDGKAASTHSHGNISNAGAIGTTANLPIITTTSGVLTTTSTADFKLKLALAKGDVGLNNVDNTSDLNKPISTATQNALNLKLNKSVWDENFEIVNQGQANEYIRAKKSLASVGDITAFNSDNISGSFWENMPAATTTTLGGIKVGSGLLINSGVLSVDGDTFNLTNYFTKTESDDRYILDTHPANSITSANITNWNTAYGWGDHEGLYSLLAHNHKEFVDISAFGGDVNTLNEAYKLKYNARVTAAATNLFPVSNNANAVLTINTHHTYYQHQLGFSSDGNIYTRNNTGESETAFNTWQKIYDEGNFIAGTHYQAPLTNPVTGTGTTNYLPKWTGLTTLGNSTIFDDGSSVTIDAVGKGTLNIYDRQNLYAGEQRSALQFFGKWYTGSSGLAYLGSVAGIGYYDGYARGGLAFNTALDGVPTERMRITYDGNVGIGTINPTSNVTISKASTQSIKLETPSQPTYTTTITNNYDASDKFKIDVGGINSFGVKSFGVISADTYMDGYYGTVLATLGIPRLYVAQFGNVGIGTTTPNGKFNVKDGDIYFDGTGTRNVYVTRDGGSTLNIGSSTTAFGSTVGTTTDSPLRLRTNNADRLYIANSTGNIGIGTTDPTEKLDVNGSARFRSVGVNPIVSELGIDASGILTTKEKKIGGRNLAKNSDLLLQTNGYNIGTVDLWEDLQDGEIITVTVWGELDPAQQLYIGKFPSTTHLGIIYKNEYGVYTSTATFTAGSDWRNRLTFYNYPSSGNLTGYISKIKVERGHKSTDWTLAEEEVLRKHNITQHYLLKSDGAGGLWRSIIYENGLNADVGGNVNIKVGTSGSPTLGLYTNNSTLVSKYWYDYANNSVRIDNPSGAGISIHGSTGNVGIGTTAPVNKFESVGSSPTVFEAVGFYNNYAYGDANKAETRINIGKLEGTTRQPMAAIGAFPNSNIDSSNGGLAFYTRAGGSLSERVRVASYGGVGIGTTAPLALLHISGYTNTGVSYPLLVQNTYGVDNAGVATGLGFMDEAATGIANIKAGIVFERIAGYGVGTLHFLTNNTIDASAATLADARMSITRTGNVGIGNTNPQGKVVIQSTVAPTLFYGQNDATLSVGTMTGGATNNIGGGINFGQKYFTGDNAIINTGAIYSLKTVGSGAFGGGLAFYAQPNSSGNMIEVMRYNHLGNVGIGTTNPQSKFQVKPTADVNFAVSYGVVTPSAVMLNAYNDGVTANIPMEFRATSYNFTLGKIGIGMANIPATLSVGTASTTRSMIAYFSEAGFVNGSQWGLSLFSDPATGNYPFYFYNDYVIASSPVLSLSRLNNYVGIGIEAPAQKLDVNGNIRVRGVGSVTTSTVLGLDSNGDLTTTVSLPAGNLTGTIPSAVLGNSSVYLGTTAVALNRASAALTLNDVTSQYASNVYAIAATNNAEYYPTFVSGSSAGQKQVRIDTQFLGLTYNPYYARLTALNVASSGIVTDNITSVNGTISALKFDTIKDSPIQIGTGSNILKSSNSFTGTGWVGTNTAIVSSYTESPFSSSLLGSLISYQTAATYSLKQTIASTATGAYTLSAWVKGTAGNTITFKIGYNTSSVGLTQNVTLTADWQRVSFTYTYGSHTSKYIDISATSSTANFYLYGVQFEAGSSAGVYVETGSTFVSTPKKYVTAYTDLLVRGNITASSEVTAYSDSRLKNEIGNTPDTLEKVNQVRVVDYTLKDDSTHKQRTGVIAQELLDVFPQFVSGSNEDYYSVNYAGMVSVALKAIQELTQQVKELREELNNYKNI